MSFYTALTGLNGSQADISASSNNIANVGTTGFKRSRAEFGDIFATSPLQNSSSSIGSGAIIKGVKQQFTQGNIASSLNALDLAISGQGFFCLKPSLTSSQTVYTRNGSFNVDNNRNVVDSSGQFLLTYPVNEDGSVTAKDLDSALPLQLPVTSGAPQATSNIDLAVNLDSGSVVVPDQDQFSGGYAFDPNDPNSFTNSTSLTIFDDLGNPTIATVYFIKTQSSADASGDGNNKFDTRLVINDTIINPNLVPSVDDSGAQIFIDRFGKQMTEVPDDNFFLEGKGSILYKLDDLNQHVDSEPARMTGQASAFDFGAEGNNLVEIVNDPMLFKSTREAGNTGNIYWGKDFLAVSVDDADTPVSVDLRPGQYNAQELAAEVERAINAAYGDDRKLQVRSNVDDKLTIDLFSLGATGALTPLPSPISVDLLQESYVTQQRGIDVEGASPDFLHDEFLAHSQILINKEMNERMATIPGASANQFARAISDPIVNIQEKTEVFKFDYTHRDISMTSLNVSDPGFSVSFSEGRINVNGTASLAAATDVSFQIGTPGDMRSITATIPAPSSGVYQTAGQIAGRIKAAMDIALEPVQLGSVSQIVEATGAADAGYAVAFAPATETFTVTGAATGKGTLQFTLQTAEAPMNVDVSIAAGDSASDIATKIAAAIEAKRSNLVALGITPFAKPETASTATTFTMGARTQTITTSGATETGYSLAQSNQTVVVTGTSSAAGTLAFNLTSAEGEVVPISVTVPNGANATAIGALIATAIGSQGNTDVTSLTGTNNAGTVTLAGGKNLDDSFSLSSVSNAIPFHAVDNSVTTSTTGSIVVGRTEPRYMMHSYFGEKPTLTVYDKQTAVKSGVDITYQANNNILLLPIGENHPDISYYEGKAEQKIMLAGTFSGQASVLNGRELKIDSVADGFVRINTSGMGFPEADFEITATNAFILSDESDNVEAFFEGAGMAPEGSTINFNNKRIVLREKPAIAHSYSDDDIKALTSVNMRDFTAVEKDTTTAQTDMTFAFSGAGDSIGLTVDWDGTTTKATTITFKIDSLFGADKAVSIDIAAGSTTAADIAEKIETALKGLSPSLATFSNGSDTYTLTRNGATLSWSHNQTSIFNNMTNQIATTSNLTEFGLTTLSSNIADNWVDELDPPVTIEYDNFNQVFKFGVNHTQIGPGTDGNFRAISVSGSPTADSTNNLGIPDAGTARAVTIGSDTQVLGQPFVVDGTELQISAKRFGVDVTYNSDSQTFTFSSGTSGEEVPVNGALSVDSAQPASNIQVGRYSINSENGSILDNSVDSGSRTLAVGNSDLMGVGAAKSIFFQAGRGLQSDPAVATGASANEPLNEIFSMSDITGDTTFNISVNGVAGIIKVPPGNYVGGTLATALETRINQISSPSTGVAVGGVRVAYVAATNNFTFTTGTTGDTSTIKVKGAARLGLDDVALGVGSVPQITNLVQATNADGVPLYVDENGDTVTNPPANLVEDFFPLYLDEGEITFSKSGEIVSPKNKVRYEQQASGFSISLDMDYSASTQLATPFAVNNINQDGFTSGRLDGVDIDATGLLRANYTNGQNKPLGKLVMANFNNQNGLKQIGNATYVETAVSGTPTVGEAGSEGFGSIQSGSLERSNVDITEELVNLITAQRNFQASSKAIETSTQLTQTIIQIRS
jgi:flagellar hook-basal body protein